MNYTIFWLVALVLFIAIEIATMGLCRTDIGSPINSFPCRNHTAFRYITAIYPCHFTVQDVIEVVDEDWISVKYDNKIGYVSAEFVDLDFHIDEGETIASIKAREKAEAEAKAKLTANQGAVAVGADDTRLLAALI